MKQKTIFLFSAIFFIFLSQEIIAEELQEKFHDWSVFKTDRGDQTICYLISTPIKQDYNFNKRGEPFFLLVYSPNEADEISVSSGFYYDKKSDVEISFPLKKFYLFPYDSLAWANDKNEDIEITKEMQKQESFVVTGIAKDGRISRDTYSLIGFITAHKKIREFCKSLS